MTMNPVIKAQWVAALRSGEFAQGRSYLNNNRLHCCLGVLCELAFRAGVVDRRVVHEDSLSKIVGYGQVNHEGVPPEEVATWAGFYPGVRNPVVSIDGRDIAISTVNDELRKSFPEIADLIEEQL